MEGADYARVPRRGEGPGMGIAGLACDVGDQRGFEGFGGLRVGVVRDANVAPLQNTEGGPYAVKF